jgi:Ca2+-binding EF-hand superfamily protein
VHSDQAQSAAWVDLFRALEVRNRDLVRQLHASESVDAEEFAEAIQALGYEAPMDETRALFAQFDSDASGCVDYRELQRAVRGSG